jgi:hypothetical protein
MKVLSYENDDEEGGGEEEKQGMCNFEHSFYTESWKKLWTGTFGSHTCKERTTANRN